jgi:catechol 2,3-dioxygenase-like lactoylglutathione lyase family enzyme
MDQRIDLITLGVTDLAAARRFYVEGLQWRVVFEVPGEVVGIRPAFAFDAFSNLEKDLRSSIGQIKASPFIPHKDKIRGFIYDVKSGRLNEVAVEAAATRR